MSHKLVFAYPGDLTLKTGGYGYDRQLIAGLQALGWKVELLPLGNGFPSPSKPVKRDAEARLSALPAGTRVMIDGLAFGVLDDWAAREAQRLNLIALVHHPLAMETGLTGDQQVTLKASEVRALSFVKHCFVTSPATARELISQYDLPAPIITVAQPGTEKAPVSLCNGNPPNILAIGSLIPRKAHDVLVNTLHDIEDLDWQATIVGNHSLHPPTADALHTQIKTLGLQHRIQLMDTCEDTRALLANADIFALASRYEGYGMVFAEALSQGVPIVACRGGAIPDVVPETAGLLVSVDDTQNFASGLRQLLENKSLHQTMAKSARAAGEKLPTWQDTASTVVTVLEKIQ